MNFSITKSISSHPGTCLNHTSIISELKLSFLQLRYGKIAEEGISRESSGLYKRMITTKESNRNVLKWQNCVLQFCNWVLQYLDQNLKHHMSPERSEEHLHTELPGCEMICPAVHTSKQDGINSSPGQQSWDVRDCSGKHQSFQKLLELVEYSHHSRKSPEEVWKGQSCCGRRWILGTPDPPERQSELTDSDWSVKGLARGTTRATGAWTETFQCTNENQELQQVALKKAD